MRDRVFIDSNIFLYAFNDADLQKHTRAIEAIISSNYESVISVQIINEVSNNMLKKLNFSNSEVKEFIVDSYQRYEVQTITKEIFTNACDIRDSYNVSYYDSLILSAALFCECQYILSEDMQHKQSIFDKLTIINPFTK